MIKLTSKQLSPQEKSVRISQLGSGKTSPHCFSGILPTEVWAVWEAYRAVDLAHRVTESLLMPGSALPGNTGEMPLEAAW